MPPSPNGNDHSMGMILYPLAAVLLVFGGILYAAWKGWL